MKDFKNNKIICFLSVIIIILIIVIFILILKDKKEEKDLNLSLNTTLLVYLENISQTERNNIEKEILNTNNIYEIKYESKEEFVDNIKKEYSYEQYPILNNEIDILKHLIESNKLNELMIYDTYLITLKDATKLDKTIKEIENIKNVKQVKKTNLDNTENENKENLFNYLNENNTIIVFLKNNITIEDTKRIEKEIRATKNIEELTFISKQEAANNMKEDNETFSTIIDTWTDETNPLLDSFKLKIKNILKIDETVELIKNIDGVNNVQY